MITICVPTIPQRTEMLRRALHSIERQTIGTDMTATSVAVDVDGRGAAVTRQRALDGIVTPWVAFLDDDDEFMPHHLETLVTGAREHDADYVYSHYEVVGGTDPRSWALGRRFDPDDPHQTTVVTLVKTELAQDVGFLRGNVSPDALARPERRYSGEDWQFTLGCVALGARIVHIPKVTWRWYHHGGNTSGLPKNVR